MRRFADITLLGGENFCERKIHRGELTYYGARIREGSIASELYPSCAILPDVTLLRESVYYLCGICVSNAEFTLDHSGGEVAVFSEQSQNSSFGKLGAFFRKQNELLYPFRS